LIKHNTRLNKRVILLGSSNRSNHVTIIKKLINRKLPITKEGLTSHIAAD